jgi:hypothetical protein
MIVYLLNHENSLSGKLPVYDLAATSTETTKPEATQNTSVPIKTLGAINKNNIQYGIKDGVYTTVTFSFKIPPTWKAVDPSSVSFKDIDLTNTNAVFQLGTKNCFVIFEGTVVVKPDGLNLNTLKIDGHLYTVISEQSGGGKSMDFPTPTRVVSVIKNLPVGGPQTIIYNSEIGDGSINQWHGNVSCQQDFFYALSNNLKFKTKSPLFTLNNEQGAELILRDPQELYTTQGDENRPVMSVRNGTENLFIQLSSLNTSKPSRPNTQNPLTLYGTKLYFYNQNYYLESVDLWNNTTSKVELLGVNTVRKDIGPGHNVMYDYTIYKNKIWYLVDEPCTLTSTGNLCNIELRSFDLSTQKDTKVALAQSHKILGINANENVLYAEDYMGELQKCPYNKGGVVKITLSTGAIQVVVPGLCGSAVDPAETSEDIQKRDSLKQSLISNIVFTDSFRINDHSFSPLPLTNPNIGFLIRFVSN